MRIWENLLKDNNMTKYILYIIIIASFIGCRDSVGEVFPDIPDDGLVRINVITPFIGTKSVTAPMPENSTIRLFVYKKDTWGTSAPTLVDERTYRVTANGGTVLCTVDPLTGKPTGDISGTALHLPADTYNFYSVSPAVALERNSSSALPGLKLNHGSNLSLRTSILENKKIEYFSGEVSGGKPGIFNLHLNTHTLLTSKITFKLQKGDRVTAMEFVDTESLPGETKLRSVVIGGLPPINYGSHNFIIGSNRLSQVLTGTGTGVLGLSLENITKPTDPQAGYDYYFETEVLPCRLLDSEGRPIPGANEDNLSEIAGSQLEKKVTELRLHLNVAGETGGSGVPEMNYKMYTVVLPEQSFLRGKSYNYTLSVSLGGILVSGWDTSSDWETIIE